MKNPVKCGVITGFLGKTRDRFHEYNSEMDLEEKFRVVAGIDGMDGVEVVYPYEVSDPAATRRLLEKYELKVAAVNVNVKAEPEFRNGGLTSPDRAVREKAVRFIKEAKDFAKAVRADKVTCCPLADGYEFNFQTDYSSAWKRLVETFGEAGGHLEEIPLFVEYKPSETRGRCHVDTAAKTLCLLNAIGNNRIGVTLDFGHSLYGNENPSEALSLLAGSPYPYYIHINDNDGRWDWDYMVGTKHFLDYVEFLFYLREYNYTDYLTSDTSPTRWDIKETFESNVRMTNRIWSRLERTTGDALKKLVGGGNFMETWRYIEENLLGLK